MSENVAADARVLVVSQDGLPHALHILYMGKTPDHVMTCMSYFTVQKSLT